MPASMIHLLIAYKINPAGSTRFFTGTLAPDAVKYWKDKDVTHFRNLQDRSEALADLALRTPRSDDFAEGVLLHLYTDWRWDILARDEFIRKTGEDWFLKYRNEIKLSGCYAFHHTSWAGDIWDRIYQCDAAEYGEIPGATAEDLKDFIIRNYKWHRENETEASSAFTPEFIRGFVEKTADEYTMWRAGNGE